MNTFVINNLHKDFKINDIECDISSLEAIINSFLEKKEDYQRKIGFFLSEFLNNNDYIELHTSGTTGIPKKVQVKKEYMIQSARITGNFLQLKPKDTALCALPVDYIAGKMMLVRAMVLGLSIDLVLPSTTPFSANFKTYDFTALTPMQAIKSLEELHRVKKIILGGAPISAELESSLQKINSKIYATYGMTETVSHIAMRCISPYSEDNSLYKALGNVTFETDERECLIINCPEVASEQIKTNDVISLIGNQAFEWKGRYDNIINSGGIKIFPEAIENKLTSFISDRFVIWKEPDNILGEKVILFVESQEEKYPNLLNKLQKETIFSKYELPKKINFIPHFQLTDSGKIRRKETANSFL